jgi:hypothetical protein
MLISVHIRKAGGSTFKRALQNYYGEKLFLDYGDQVGSGGLAAKIKRFSRRLISPTIKNREFDVIHGHFYASKYNKLNGQYAVILRDPVARVLSNYFYLQRVYKDRKNADAIPFLRNENLSLLEYIKLKDSQNLQSRTLGEKKLDDFDFVGVTEKMEQSVKNFNKIFNARLTLPTSENTNPSQKHDYNISEEIRNEIIEANAADMNLYSRAIAIFDEQSKSEYKA